MSTNHHSIAVPPHHAGGEGVRLIGQIQALRRDVEVLRRRGKSEPELRAKERTLERLRWRLATAARQAANRAMTIH